LLELTVEVPFKQLLRFPRHGLESLENHEDNQEGAEVVDGGGAIIVVLLGFLSFGGWAVTDAARARVTISRESFILRF
jgi:hypothetical protein